MEEVWKDIDGFEGLYQVSNYGRVKSLNYNRSGKEQILKPKTAPNGYLHVCLYSKNKRKYITIHRLVAQMFLDNPNNLPCINHKSEDKTDNSVNNIEYCDYKYNNNYGKHNEKVVKANTENCHYKKLSNLLRKLKSKKVKQYNLKNGDLIKIWESTRQVERETGFDNSHISACCNHKLKTAYGFRWEYSENEQE